MKLRENIKKMQGVQAPHRHKLTESSPGMSKEK